MEVKEPFLVNPPRKRRKKHKGFGFPFRFSRSRNPIGESLMIAGLNPKRRRKHRNARRRRRHNAWLGHSGGHRRAALLGWRHRNEPGHRRKRRYNPAGVMAPVEKALGISFPSMGNLLGAGTGIIVTGAMPRVVNTAGVTWQKYGTEVVTVLAGGFVFNMLPSGPRQLRGFTPGFVAGGLAWIFAEAIREFVLPMIPGAAAFKGFGYAPSLPAFGPGYQGLEAYEPLSDVGAFPLGDGFGAFPGEEAGYETPFIPGEGTSVY